MSASIEVWLNEDCQVIEQRISGALTAEQFQELDRRCTECARRLRDPTQVRVLVDGTKLKWTDLKARRAAMEPFGRDEDWWLAIWGGDRITRIMTGFMALAAGTKRIKMFADRAGALEWLLQQTPLKTD
ncbi:MAG: hypothetical protein GF331_09260 [Chitinivibrionales bacterium]|nr:hypothetical protein [Chitinivibrionales bacterium]